MAKRSKENGLQTPRPATVVESLPNDLFRVELNDQSRLVVHVSGRRKNDFLRLLPGDKVRVELSSHDDRRGRIVQRDPS